MYQQHLTDAGRDVIAKGQTGLVIRFTRIALGEGEVTVANIPAMTALVNPVMNAPIIAVARTAVGQATITTKIPLDDIPKDFFLTELGVYAEVGNEPEVLYAVSVAGEFPDPISPTMPGGALSEHTIAIAVVIGTTENVTAVFSPADIEVVNIGPPTVGPGFYADRVANQFRFKRAVGEGVKITETNNTVVFSMPTGFMSPYAGAIAPEGWLLCQGQEVSRTGQANLFSVIGTTYGIGNGSTTYNLPDARGRSLIGAGQAAGLSNRTLGQREGAETHTLTVGQMPSHNHDIQYSDPQWGGVQNNWHSHVIHQVLIDVNTLWGNVYVFWYGAPGYPAYRATPWGIASYVVPSGGNQAHPNMSPFLVTNYIIKT